MDAAWHEKHRTGMAAAASKTAAHRMSGETLARVRRESNERFPCKIKGCKRTAYKGSLCRGHWSMVPNESKVQLTLACFAAQLDTARKHHARMLRELQARLKAEAA